MDFSLILIRMFVSDWDRTVRFYTEVLEIPLAERHDELGWAELDTGACRIALEKIGSDDADRAAITAEPDEKLLGRFVAISLWVPDIYATYERLLEREVDFLAPPAIMPWGGVLAHSRDPDKNVLTLVGEPRTDSGVAPRGFHHKP